MVCCWGDEYVIFLTYYFLSVVKVFNPFTLWVIENLSNLTKICAM
jgi:hypothetical protein